MDNKQGSFSKDIENRSLLITNGKLVSPSGILPSGYVYIKDRYITAIGQGMTPPRGAQLIDARNGYVVPGFIDLHVHGGNGADFMDMTPEAFETITRFYAQHGVTSLLATNVAAPFKASIELLKSIRNFNQNESQEGSLILGVHLEGPYLNPEQTGALDPAFLRLPSKEETKQLLAFNDVLKRVTIAPELSGAIEMIRELAAANIIVSAGHSMTREESLYPAIEAGLSLTTHIYSAMSSMVREGPWRKPGLLELTLVDDRLDSEMIADGKHLPPALMQLIWKCKGPDHLCLVSDAMAGAGRPVGEIQHLGGKDGIPVIVKDGVAMLIDETAFAGSITPLDAMVRNMVQMAGLTIEQVIPLVTSNPARILGLSTQKGSIKPGFDADLVILDENLFVQTTIIGGQIVFNKLPDPTLV